MYYVCGLTSVSWGTDLSAPNCIKHFHWTIRLFWPIRFDFTIVSTGNNCNVKPDWPESPHEAVVKSNLISQYHPVNKGNPLYNWVLELLNRNKQIVCLTIQHVKHTHNLFRLKSSQRHLSLLPEIHEMSNCYTSIWIWKTRQVKLLHFYLTYMQCQTVTLLSESEKQDKSSSYTST